MGNEHAEAHARWWQRVVPVAALAAVVVAAVLALGGGTEQVELSTHRQPQEYVELVLTRAPASVCTRPTARVPFALTSHLQGAERLRWQVRVDPVGPRRAKVARAGSVPVQPSVTRGVRTTAAVPPRKAFDLTVTLPGRPELLRVHCARVRR